MHGLHGCAYDVHLKHQADFDADEHEKRKQPGGDRVGVVGCGHAGEITTTISVCVFCAMFVAKLGVAMKERKKLGIKQFGPMRVLFIMGCQTMFIPSK